MATAEGEEERTATDLYGLFGTAPTGGELVRATRQQQIEQVMFKRRLAREAVSQRKTPEQVERETESLLAQCRALRQSHRCPGQCVLS